MTSVRQRGEVRAARSARKGKDAAVSAKAGLAGAVGPSRLAQVRLRADEMETLQTVMRTLDLRSTSDALREGLRPLAREAGEVEAAGDIRSFYHDRPAPLPDAVTTPTEAELAAADEADW